MNPWRSGILAALFVGATLSTSEREALGDDEALEGTAAAFRAHSEPFAAGLSQRIADLTQRPQAELAAESLSIWAPLADQVGLPFHQAALEDASFRTLHPDDHHRLQVAAGDAEGALDSLRSLAEQDAESLGVTVTLQGRVKSLYSTWRKMERKGVELDRIHDRVALRMITDTEDEARALLEQIHRRYKPVMGGFDDYVIHPKPNGYQSIHTTVHTPHGIAEFQLRTHAMHAAAESGDQAHWLYKRAS